LETAKIRLEIYRHYCVEQVLLPAAKDPVFGYLPSGAEYAVSQDVLSGNYLLMSNSMH